MKAFYKISAIIIGVGFLFCSLILFAVGVISGGVICLIVAIILPILIMASSKNRINGIVYDSRKVKGQGFQFLETIYLLRSTKNKKTFEGRVEFVNRIYPYLIQVSVHPRYLIDIKYSLDQYKKMYYDKTIESNDILLLTQPNREKLNELINIRIEKFN